MIWKSESPPVFWVIVQATGSESSGDQLMVSVRVPGVAPVKVLSVGDDDRDGAVELAVPLRDTVPRVASTRVARCMYVPPQVAPTFEASPGGRARGG